MNLKSIIIAEVVKGENVYRFEMPVGAPFGECYDAAFQMLNKITELAKEAAANAKPAEPKAEDVTAELN